VREKREVVEEEDDDEDEEEEEEVGAGEKSEGDEARVKPKERAREEADKSSLREPIVPFFVSLYNRLSLFLSSSVSLSRSHFSSSSSCFLVFFSLQRLFSTFQWK